MKIAITYDRAKVLQALRYHFISRNEVKLLLILVNVFAFLSAGLLFLKLIRPFPFLISSLLWFVLMLTFWFWLPRIIYNRNRTFQEDITLTLRSDDILIETAKGYTTWGYQRFSYFIESPHFFHLYINDKSFFLIPKDACTGDADTVLVRQKLKENIAFK